MSDSSSLSFHFDLFLWMLTFLFFCDDSRIGTADELRTPSTTTTSATSSSDVSSPIARPPPVPTHTLDEPPARPSRRQQDQLENNSRLRPIPTDVVPSVPSLISRE